MDLEENKFKEIIESMGLNLEDFTKEELNAMFEPLDEVVNIKDEDGKETSVEDGEVEVDGKGNITIKAESIEVYDDISYRQLEEMVKEKLNPIMNKTELISEIRKQIVEANKYEDDYSSGENYYSKKLGNDNISSMGQRLFSDISSAAQERLGKSDLGGVTMELSKALQNVLVFESQHKPELEQEAIRIIREKYPDLSEENVDIEAKITGHPMMGGTQIVKGGLQKSKGNIPKPEGYSDEELEDEVMKRRMLNGMTHGASRKGQNLVHMAGDVLSKLGPSAREDYSKLLAANDFVYWAIDRDTIKRESTSGVHAGNVVVDLEGKPKIYAQGMTFAFLLHELTKGAMELLSMGGSHQDEEVFKYVEDKTDHLDAEPDDIRLGVGLWEKILEFIDVENKKHETYFYHELVSKPAREFNEIIKGLMNNDKEIMDKVRKISNDIIEEIKNEEYEDAIGHYKDDTTPNDNKGDEEGFSDDVISNLMGGDETPTEDDYSTMSNKQLNDLLNQAIDNGDFDKAGEIGSYLN